MPQIIHQVQPGLAPIEPKFNPGVLKFVHLSLPLLLRIRLFPWLPAGIDRIDVVNGETLVQLYSQFQSGKIRLILAFRHVEVDDPLCGLYLLSRSLPKLAKTAGIPLQYPLHVHFLYDRGMPLWGGSGLGWLLSRLGGVSLRRGKRPDWQALRAARALLLDGEFPFAVAPEGATNGHSEYVGPLEPGVAQLGFWCAGALEMAERPETVWILPIGMQYFYQEAPWSHLDRLMSELEYAVGLPVKAIGEETTEGRAEQFYQRLLSIGETLLYKLEQFYRQFYSNHSTPFPPGSSPQDFIQPNLEQRIQSLLDRALGVAESHFGVKATGTPVDRCRRLEEVAWTYIYREDLPARSSLSQLDRGLADWIAQEASLRVIHMRLAESFVAVSGSYVSENPSFERFAETTLLMFDALARIRGDKLPQRPRLGWRQTRITVGKPISIGDRWKTYSTSRSSGKQAIADLTEDIRRALEATIT